MHGATIKIINVPCDFQVEFGGGGGEAAPITVLLQIKEKCKKLKYFLGGGGGVVSYLRIFVLAECVRN